MGQLQRRFVAIQFFREEKWSNEEKKSYEKWMNEAIDDGNGSNKSRKEKLKVYGDFVASYVIKHPELIHYSSFQWHEPATKILKEFYKSAGIDAEHLPQLARPNTRADNRTGGPRGETL